MEATCWLFHALRIRITSRAHSFGSVVAPLLQIFLKSQQVIDSDCCLGLDTFRLGTRPPLKSPTVLSFPPLIRRSAEVGYFAHRINPSWCLSFQAATTGGNIPALHPMSSAGGSPVHLRMVEGKIVVLTTPLTSIQTL